MKEVVETMGPNDFFENVFTTTGDGILISDNNGVIVRVNKTVEKMLGCSEAELKGRHASELVPEAIKDATYIAMASEMRTNLFEKGVVENFQSCWQRKDGTPCPVEINITLMRDEAGAAAGTVACIRDITERLKAEQALKESEERFRALAEALPEGIIAVDMQGSIVFWNTGAQNLFGYSKEEALGQPSSMLVPDRYKGSEAKGLKLLQEKGQLPLLGMVIESYGRRKDGSEFADDISIGPWQTRQSMFYVAIIRDITRRKEAQEALKNSEQRFKELADSLPQTVFEFDLNGIISFVNRKALELFGYAQADIDKGLNAIHMLVPEERLKARDNFQRAMSGEQLGGHEYTALRKDGTTFPSIIHATPVSHDGAVTGLRGILVDISQRKEMEDEILKAKRLESVSALAGGVAQDFNNILSAILGNINLAHHYTSPEDKIYNHLAAAERATLRAKDLTDQLITFAKGGTAVKKPAALGSLLRESAELALKGSQTSCDFSFSKELRPVDVDEAQMKQVFINIIINADHAMPEGGIIIFGAENTDIVSSDNLPLPNGRYVKISISDQSIGILNEHLQNIFDPYFTSRQRGSGIGLATTYTIIKNHGGLITVESEFGRGTTFFIYLPASKTQSR